MKAWTGTAPWADRELTGKAVLVKRGLNGALDSGRIAVLVLVAYARLFRSCSFNKGDPCLSSGGTLSTSIDAVTWPYGGRP